MENALILQQPVALHAYFLKEGIIQERDRILIIDGGFRTLEMTDMKQNVILNHYETELGCSKPLKILRISCRIMRERVITCILTICQTY